MIKHAIALAVVVSAAHAAGTDNTWTPLPSTLQTYTNALGAPEAFMQWQVVDHGQLRRVGIAVTGCGGREGYAALVIDYTMTDVSAWSAEGDRVYDDVARQTCALVRPTNGSRS